MRSLAFVAMGLLLTTACSHSKNGTAGSTTAQASIFSQPSLASTSLQGEITSPGNLYGSGSELTQFQAKYGYARKQTGSDGKPMVVLNFGDGSKSDCSQEDRGASRFLVQVPLNAPVTTSTNGD